ETGGRQSAGGIRAPGGKRLGRRDRCRPWQRADASLCLSGGGGIPAAPGEFGRGEASPDRYPENGGLHRPGSGGTPPLWCSHGGTQAAAHPRPLEQGDRPMSSSDRNPGMEGTSSRLEWIDHLCDAFESAWQEGYRPPIEAYLAAAAEPERSQLLEELLKLELEYPLPNK